jgi:hypothetical protein
MVTTAPVMAQDAPHEHLVLCCFRQAVLIAVLPAAAAAAAAAVSSDDDISNIRHDSAQQQHRLQATPDNGATLAN